MSSDNVTQQKSKVKILIKVLKWIEKATCKWQLNGLKDVSKAQTSSDEYWEVHIVGEKLKNNKQTAGHMTVATSSKFHNTVDC